MRHTFFFKGRMIAIAAFYERRRRAPTPCCVVGSCLVRLMRRTLKLRRNTEDAALAHSPGVIKVTS